MKTFKQLAAPKVSQPVIIAPLFLSALQNMPLLPLVNIPVQFVLSPIYKIGIKVKDFYPVLRRVLFHALHVLMKGREEWTTFMLCKWSSWASFSTLSFQLWNDREDHTIREKAQWFTIHFSQVECNYEMH